MRPVEIRQPVAVLVIDDDRIIREMLRELLALNGYGVTVAENGAEGLRRFADGRFQVVITDVCMPGLDGWQVARRLREASADVGIIVMSGTIDSGNGTRAKDCRHLATLAKPFTLEQLTATIDRLVELRLAA